MAFAPTKLSFPMKEPPIHPPHRLRVAVVQMNSRGPLAENLAKIEAFAAKAAKAGADAVLFPECATTGYAIDFARLRAGEVRAGLQAVGSLAARWHTHLLVGSPVGTGRRWVNGLVVFDRDGRLAHVYAKCQLTDLDRRWFVPGNSLSWFMIDGIRATAMICHERRYPELVRLPVMAGAQIIFHPNAGLDTLAVSKAKRGGRDGITARAFENAVPYLFANTVGPQGNGKWSAGDSKIVDADGRVLKLANHRDENLLLADLDLQRATRKYATDSLRHPRFLAPYWRGMMRELQRRASEADQSFRDWYAAG